MSAFSFVHAADLHLGSPLTGLAARDDNLARHLADAIRDAVRGLVDATLERGADFLVISGDVYDGEWKDHSVGLFFNREMARLGRAGIPVFVIKGNHDAHSVVTRSITLPSNVTVFGVRSAETHVIEHLGVALHGQSFADRQVPENLARDYPAPMPGMFNIGILHTSLTGRPPHADYAPCTLDDLRMRGYDYWALGHVHAFEVISQDPFVVYPGNIQGRNIRETGEKGAVLVSVSDGRVTELERLVVDRARFERLDVDVADCGDQNEILRFIESELRPLAAEAGGRPLAVRLRLHGETPLRDTLLSARQMLATECQAACARVGEDVFLEKLVLDLPAQQRTAAWLPADGLLDLEALLSEVANDDALVSAARGEIAQLAAKMPGGLLDAERPFGAEIDMLIDEARALLALRLGGES
ncbi:MAG: DNA repair exonuclease [Stappia sp.]|uniref:metallophosphoesterase family protein n=1 Tax=Stappia sp. TaxID=1870903 RepID=UPI000C623100|nr:DNA repair exonuclease [Stappia sp.]MAA97893.1 DNA repair exonuclease [Stappia sp.]MBM19693.1 DNA repair exonuclease [Stappia sp.]